MRALLLLQLLSSSAAAADWILRSPTTASTATPSADGCTLTLANGLLARVFAVPKAGCSAPNWATVDLLDLTGDLPKSALAALDVEAAVELNGRRYDVGGYNQTCAKWVRGKPTAAHTDSTCAYLNRTSPEYVKPTANSSAFTYAGHSTGPIVAPFAYTAARHSTPTAW